MINFIEESKRIIRKASENNKLVIFVGSGVSANSGYPSWSSLVEEFANGLGMDTKNISSEDYLKIPQYYYNSRKEKEYYDVIFNKFNVNVDTNPIHDLIFDLKPYHIITTNYDELLEEAALNKGLFYDVVSKDKDLPYTPNNNMIIKMHGELKNKNIVLKEDDYLSYYKNFKLIQNYIKSLISTHTILFVGYSISDVNVKYIFQWVKEILGKDFQQSYFLDVNEDKNFNQIEYEYYKNRGINILDYSILEKENAGKSINHRRENTCKFLKYLLDKSDNFKFDIDYVYDKLKDLNNLKQIRFEDIRIALDLEVPYYENGYTIMSHFSVDMDKLYLQTDITKKLFLEIKKFEDEIEIQESKKTIDFSKKTKIDLVKEVFFKAGIKKIVEGNTYFKDTIILEINIEQKNIKKINIEECILQYNYIEIDDYIKNMNFYDIKGNEEKYLEKAYGLYKLEKYLEAYEILKQLSESCFRNKKYFIYFISEFNRKHIGSLVCKIDFITAITIGISRKLQDKIRKEIKDIDLEDIYLKLPSNSRAGLIFLRDILNFKFIYININKTLDLKEKVKESENTIYSGTREGKKEIDTFKRDIEQLWKFITKNKFMLDNYKEVKTAFYNYIESALLSHMIEYREEEKTIWGLPGKVEKLEKIDYFTAFLMITYLDKKDINILLKKYKVEKLEIEEKDLNKIEAVFNNIINSINMEKSINKSKKALNNCIYILSRIDIRKDFFIKIIDAVMNILDKKNERDLREIYDSLETFIRRQNNNFKENVDVQKLEDILNYILNKINLSKEKSFYKNTDIFSFIQTITIVINNVNDKYILNNNNNIRVLIRQMEIEFNFKYVNEVLVYCSELLDKNILQEIVDIIYRKLNSVKEFNDNCFKLYYRAVSNKIIKNNVDLENKLLQYVEKKIKKEKTLNEKIEYMNFGTKDRVLKDIAILNFYDCIIELDKFKVYKYECEEFSFLIDMDNYNYDNFKIEWIYEYGKKLHEIVSNCEKAKKKIKEELKKEIIKNNCDKNIKKIFFKYYD